MFILYNNDPSYSHVSPNTQYIHKSSSQNFPLRKNLTRFKLGGTAFFSSKNFSKTFLYLFFSFPSALVVPLFFPPPSFPFHATRIITLPTSRVRISLRHGRGSSRNETRVRRAIAFARPPKGAASWSPLRRATFHGNGGIGQ